MHIMFRLIALLMIFTSAQVVTAAEESAAVNNEASDAAAGLSPAHQAWPERPVHKTDLPPPPPGPYMSTALTYTGQGFSCCPGDAQGKDEKAQQQMHSPFFRNMPWPERKLPPQQWLPEGGGEYTFAPDVNSVTTESVPDQRYGYQGVPPWQPMYPPAPQRYR